jgi:putative nucleotidyltransferase with HDIG domain
MRFRELPLRMRVLIWAQSAAAAVTLYWLWAPIPPQHRGSLLLLALCCAVGGICKVDVNVRLGRLTLGFTVAYIAFLLLGTVAAVLVGLAGTLAGMVFNLKEERRRFDLRKALSCHSIYNYGNCVLATAAMGWVFTRLGGTFGRVDVGTVALPVLASAAAYYVVNNGGVVLAIAWSQGKKPVDVFKNHFAWAWSGYLAGAAVSAAMLWVSQAASLNTWILLLLPGYLVFNLYRLRTEKTSAELRHAQEQNRLNDAVISSLVMAIDAKDRHTSKHVNRVREYALSLARNLGVPDDEVQAVRIASLLHDIGKIGIPERILCKPGKLTPEEFEIIKSHVEIGAAILEQVQFPWPVVPIVRTHHERWDGLGYPGGLKGEEIPVGGRIISLVDVYDALTSDRPYRKAIPPEKAIEILRAGSGTQFDPEVVEAFIEILPEADTVIRELERAGPDEAACVLESVARRAEQIEGPPPEEDVDEAALLEELAAALRREPNLTAAAPVLAERLGALAPYTTLALYLVDGSRRSLVPVFGDGLWTSLLEGLEIRLGEGTSGYVAATGEPEVNAAASLDLARRIRPRENLELNSTLCVPMLLGREVVGVLTLYHSSYSFYRPYHLRRVSYAARHLMEAAAAGRWLEGDLPLPGEDPVTRLPNAHALRHFIHGRTAVAQSREEEFALVLAGMDEADGPPRSAETIAGLATLLREVVRDGDYLAHASPSQLALVLSRCGEREARQIAQRLLERAGGRRLRVALAFYPQDGGASALLDAGRERLSDSTRKGALASSAGR